MAERLREIRRDLFGENGGPILADALDLPFRAWAAYEAEGTIPAEVLLDFLAMTDAHPRWLRSGQGPKFAGAGDACPLL